MKHAFLLLLILFFAAASLFLVGCGSDDDDNGGGNHGVTPPDPHDFDDFDFAFVMMELDESSRDGDWMVMLYPTNATNVPTSVTLAINSVEVYLSQYMGVWTGTLMGVSGGDNLAIQCVVDGTTYNEDLTACHEPSVDFPVTWDMHSSMNLAWTMGGDNMYQEFWGSAYWWGATPNDEGESMEEQLLSPSARAYTVPANWLGIPTGLEADVSFELNEMNWAYNNRFIALCSAYDYADYWSYDRTRPTPQELAQRSLDRVLKLIGE